MDEFGLARHRLEQLLRVQVLPFAVVRLRQGDRQLGAQLGLRVGRGVRRAQDLDAVVGLPYADVRGAEQHLRGEPLVRPLLGQAQAAQQLDRLVAAIDRDQRAGVQQRQLDRFGRILELQRAAQCCARFEIAVEEGLANRGEIGRFAPFLAIHVDWTASTPKRIRRTSKMPACVAAGPSSRCGSIRPCAARNQPARRGVSRRWPGPCDVVAASAGPIGPLDAATFA